MDSMLLQMFLLPAEISQRPAQMQHRGYTRRKLEKRLRGGAAQSLRRRRHHPRLLQMRPI